MSEHKRTPSSAMMTVIFRNGETWEVPVQVVADNRDAEYADEEEDTIGSIKAGRLDSSELTDWAANNMDWIDLAPHGKKVAEPGPADLEDEWGEAQKEVGEL